MGVPSLVSEILLLSKTANFPFPTMDYSPWSSKSSINRNQLNKFMQIGMDVKCMHTNFGGRDLFGFGDIATIKNDHFSLSDHGHQKFNRSESSKKIHASINSCQMHAHQFWWVCPLWFRRYCYFQKRPIFPFRPWTIVHGHQKIQSIRISSKNSCKYKLMRHACTLILVGMSSLFSEILLLSKTANFPFPTMDYSPWSSKNSIDRNRLKKFMQV